MGRRDSMSQWGTASETCVEVCSCLRGSTFGHRREQPCKHGGSRGASQEQHGGHVASAKCRRLDYLCSYLTLDHSYLRTGSTVTTKGTLQSPKLRACSLTSTCIDWASMQAHLPLNPRTLTKLSKLFSDSSRRVWEFDWCCRGEKDRCSTTLLLLLYSSVR